MMLPGHNIELMSWRAWLLPVAGGIVLWLVMRRDSARYRRSIADGEK